ncbi:hypothetical protein [Methanoculleus chikugoensis]|uniref:hypothetical protein n=1 Tax=Methanoculleus chikugoensis TaxID=118126 RepID=UPI001C80C61F|nr:hypothetical protein [Methanoculleus chikugoensis]
MVVHIVGEPVPVVTECFTAHLRIGEETPYLRVLPEDLMHLHGCLEEEVVGGVDIEFIP